MSFCFNYFIFQCSQNFENGKQDTMKKSQNAPGKPNTNTSFRSKTCFPLSPTSLPRYNHFWIRAIILNSCSSKPSAPDSVNKHHLVPHIWNPKFYTLCWLNYIIFETAFKLLHWKLTIKLITGLMLFRITTYPTDI